MMAEHHQPTLFITYLSSNSIIPHWNNDPAMNIGVHFIKVKPLSIKTLSRWNACLGIRKTEYAENTSKHAKMRIQPYRQNRKTAPPKIFAAEILYLHEPRNQQ